MHGMALKNPVLSGMLREPTRPVYDAAGREIKEGFSALCGDVDDYRVADSLGIHFTLLGTKKGERALVRKRNAMQCCSLRPRVGGWQFRRSYFRRR